MDDEEMIRELINEVLTEIGYEVETAADGNEAIDFYKRIKESGKTFDAVIIDLEVPLGMGGKGTVKKLLEIDPGVKAIVSSGYSNDSVFYEYEKYGFRTTLPKPYMIQELGEILSKMINANG
jgi:DNA-binding NtrC family response regulator